MIGRPTSGGKWHRVHKGDLGAFGFVYLACTGRNIEVTVTFEDKADFEKTTGNKIRDREICMHRPCRYERKAK